MGLFGKLFENKLVDVEYHPTKAECVFKKGDLVRARVQSIDRNYFKGKVKKVLRVTDGPDYAGGQFVYVNINGKEEAFYSAALSLVEVDV